MRENHSCSSIVRGRWFIVIKKATRQQFYGMLTGSVIIDSVQTDNHHIYDAKVMLLSLIKNNCRNILQESHLFTLYLYKFIEFQRFLSLLFRKVQDRKKVKRLIKMSRGVVCTPKRLSEYVFDFLQGSHHVGRFLV